MRSSAFVVGVFCFVVASVGTAAANSGALDPTFGHGGRVVTTIHAIPSDVQVQVDGKIDVAGGPGVVRFTPSGVLDSGFGNGGAARVGFSASSMALQPDGKIVVVGSVLDTYGQPIQAAVARLTPTGALDAGFADKGVLRVTFESGATNVGSIVTLQPDGKILVGGLARIGGCIRTTFTNVMRLNQDGSFDTGFGSGGMSTQRGILFGVFNSLAVETNGKILALGDSNTVARFLANGTRDTSVVGGTIGSIAHVGVSTFQPDGKVVFGSTIYEDFDYDMDMQAQRYMPTRVADSNFHSPVIDFGATAPANQVVADAANAVAFEPNGRILIAGIAQASNYSSMFGLARFDPLGHLDSTFGTSGRVTTAFLYHAQVTALAVQTDGKIIAAGTTYGTASNATSRIALARYLGP